MKYRTLPKAEKEKLVKALNELFDDINWHMNYNDPEAYSHYRELFDKIHDGLWHIVGYCNHGNDIDSNLAHEIFYLGWLLGDRSATASMVKVMNKR